MTHNEAEQRSLVQRRIASVNRAVGQDTTGCRSRARAVLRRYRRIASPDTPLLATEAPARQPRTLVPPNNRPVMPVVAQAIAMAMLLVEGATSWPAST